ncbi:unnamed protein product [Lactuca virosa]|uniref:Uncharacterized protein n=1 Tax=Lactuca virosa TaxID=75947 RepID=A0AAU9NGT7_9ASTR|nr:unnamed protein product [Lactuca virosa]
MIAPPPGKFVIYIKYFDVGYCLPSSDFLLELLDHHKIHIDQLVPFEMLCWCNGIVSDLWVFRYIFFRLSTLAIGDNYTFCVRKYIQILVIDRKGSPNNWQNPCLRVYSERLGCMFCCFKSSSDIVIDMFPEKENVAKVLRSFKVVADDFPEEVALVDKALPSFYFQTEQFIARATVVQEAERLAVGVSCTNALEAILYEGFVEGASKFDSVEDSKEGVLTVLWSLGDNVRIFVFFVAKEYIRHVFPPGIVEEMSSYPLADVIGPLRFLAAQSSCFLVEATRQLQEFVKVTATEKANLEERVAYCEQENTYVKELAEKVRQENEGLVIQLECVERDVVEHDRLVVEKTVALEEARRDRQWLLIEGVVGVIDKVLDSLEFVSGVNRFQGACLDGDCQEGRRAYREALMAGNVNMEDENFEVDFSDDMNRAIELFSTLISPPYST